MKIFDDPGTEEMQVLWKKAKRETTLDAFSFLYQSFQVEGDALSTESF